MHAWLPFLRLRGQAHKILLSHTCCGPSVQVCNLGIRPLMEVEGADEPVRRLSGELLGIVRHCHSLGSGCSKAFFWSVHLVCGRVGGNGCYSLGGGVMVSRTSPWSQPFVRTGGDGSMSVRETHNKLIPTCSWNASLIQLLRDPNASIVTCRTFTNRIWRLFTMKSLLWRKDRPNRQTSVGLDGREVLAQPSQ